MDLQSELVETENDITAILALIKPYEAQLKTLYDRRHFIKSKMFAKAHGMQLGDELLVTQSLYDQQIRYGWNTGAWPVGTLVHISGVAFADDRGVDEFVVRFDEHSSTCTPPHVVKEMRTAYLAQFTKGE